jgi:hypothetical protein
MSNWSVTDHFAKVKHSDIWDEKVGSYPKMFRNGKFMRFMKGPKDNSEFVRVNTLRSLDETA